MSCPYCGVQSTDTVAHAEERHGISRREQEEHSAEGYDWEQIQDGGLWVPSVADEHPGQYL